MGPGCGGALFDDDEAGAFPVAADGLGAEGVAVGGLKSLLGEELADSGPIHPVFCDQGGELVVVIDHPDDEGRAGSGRVGHRGFEVFEFDIGAGHGGWIGLFLGLGQSLGIKPSLKQHETRHEND
jgi:hypothetical protein